MTDVGNETSTGINTNPTTPWHITASHASSKPLPPSELAVTLLTHGSLSIEYYAPKAMDRQMPHTRDEIYVIASGQGQFVNGDLRHPFGTSDVIFVPAGRVHRFEEFTEDFATWVFFYGPEGGEQTA